MWNSCIDRSCKCKVCFPLLTVCSAFNRNDIDKTRAYTEHLFGMVVRQRYELSDFAQQLSALTLWVHALPASVASGGGASSELSTDRGSGVAAMQVDTPQSMDDHDMKSAAVESQSLSAIAWQQKELLDHLTGTHKHNYVRLAYHDIRCWWAAHVNCCGPM